METELELGQKFSWILVMHVHKLLVHLQMTL